jgi:hypothetical protein
MFPFGPRQAAPSALGPHVCGANGVSGNQAAAVPGQD